MIQAVTFDFWDTIVADDSDEPKRKALGLPSKATARVATFVQEIRTHHPEIPAQKAADAVAHANARFRHWWKVDHHTPDVATRLGEGLGFLGIGPTPGFEGVVHAWETMEVEHPPDLAPGIREALDALKGRVRIGIISDAIVTPGTGLREILKGYGLFDYFDDFVFSDEAGASKPDRKVFDLAAMGLGTPLSGLAHIGDREANDVLGPNGCGAWSVLYTGVIDRGSAETAAHVVVRDHKDLAEAVLSLGAK